jgi:hypothetical protein
MGSMLQKEWGIDEDVSQKIKAHCLKWRKAYGVLCNSSVSLKLKDKFYRIAILYGVEC